MNKFKLLALLFLALPLFMGKSCNPYDPSTADISLGGQNLGSQGVQAVPLETDAFTNTAAISQQNSIGLNNPRRDHTSTLLLDGRVLIVGGESNGTAIGDAELYDQGTGEFQPSKATLTSARMRHTATLLTNGNVLIAGGQDTQLNPLQSLEVYDPNLDQFTLLLSTFSVPRYGHTATLLENSGQILYCGGFKDGQSTPEATPTADLFTPADPPGQKIQAVDDMLDNRAHHAAALIPGPDQDLGTADDRVLVTYGIGTFINPNTGNPNYILRNNFLVFDPTQPSSNQWQTPTGVTGQNRRWEHHAIQTRNDNHDVIIMAGITSTGLTNYTSPQCGAAPRDDGSGPEASVEVYRPLSNNQQPNPQGAIQASAVTMIPPDPMMDPFVGGSGSVATRHPNGGVFLAAGVMMTSPPCTRVYSQAGYLIDTTDADPNNWQIEAVGRFQNQAAVPNAIQPNSPNRGALNIAHAFSALSLLPGNDGFGNTPDDALLITGGQETGPNWVQSADVYNMPTDFTNNYP